MKAGLIFEQEGQDIRVRLFAEEDASEELKDFTIECGRLVQAYCQHAGADVTTIEEDK